MKEASVARDLQHSAKSDDPAENSVACKLLEAKDKHQDFYAIYEAVHKSVRRHFDSDSYDIGVSLIPHKVFDQKSGCFVAVDASFDSQETCRMATRTLQVLSEAATIAARTQRLDVEEKQIETPKFESKTLK